MLKRKERSKSALVLALLLAPPAAYAAWVFAAFLLDTYLGDGLMQHQYFHESRRQLAIQMLSDAREALPVFYVAGLLLWLEIRLISRFGGGSGFLPAVVAGALTGFAAASVFAGLISVVIAPAILSALLMSLVLSWAVRPSGVQG